MIFAWIVMVFIVSFIIFTHFISLKRMIRTGMIYDYYIISRNDGIISKQNKQKTIICFWKVYPKVTCILKNIKSAFETRGLRTGTQPPLYRMELGPWNINWKSRAFEPVRTVRRFLIPLLSKHFFGSKLDPQKFSHEFSKKVTVMSNRWWRHYPIL